MLKKQFKTWGAAAALSMLMGSAHAGVSADQAAKLGTELTPVGAVKEAQGNIPAWTGGLSVDAASVDKNGRLGNPFAGDKPEFVITAANYKDYAANLTDGQKAMFEKYPDTYKMPVYKTVRSAAYPQEVYDETKKNAVNTSLLNDGNGIANFTFGVPFPFPQTGVEVIWNHITRYRGGSVSRIIGQVTPQVNGDYTVVRFKDEFTYRNNLVDFQADKDDNVLFYFKQDVLSPARLAGNVLLVHETLDQVKEPASGCLRRPGYRV